MAEWLSHGTVAYTFEKASRAGSLRPRRRPYCAGISVFDRLFVKETGGQMYYKGRDMALTFAGMEIAEADWTRCIEVVVGVAGDMGVGETDGGEVMGFLESLQREIVTV